MDVVVYLFFIQLTNVPILHFLLPLLEDIDTAERARERRFFARVYVCFSKVLGIYKQPRPSFFLFRQSPVLPIDLFLVDEEDLCASRVFSYSNHF